MLCHVFDIMLLWQRILFGIVNPSGRAAVSTPVSSAALPAYYSFKSSGARGGWCDVKDGSSSILWNFGALRRVVQCSYCWRSPVMRCVCCSGHGLSYTTFEFSNLVIRNAAAGKSPSAVIGPADSVAVSCNVRNTGARAGTETVQVYVRDEVASVTTPHMALKAFAKVELAPRQQKTVNLVIDVAEQLRILNREWRFVVEPGVFVVMVGPASDNTPLLGNFSVVE
eukprot:COSAG01_NODE_1885_length_8988_cov_2.861514_11_plen_225_part_00